MTELWSWGLFAAVLATFLAIDLFMVQRRSGPLTIKSALVWVAIWVSIGLGFAVFVWQTRGTEAAGAYLAGYLIEYSLSADNVFVFAMLFAYFAVPAENQRRLLFWGVLGAIVFRGIFILGGIALIHVFEPVIYVFGVLLILTGIKMARSGEEGMDPEGNAVLRVIRRRLPVSERYDGPRFFTRRNGRLLATPLFAALVAVELSDVMFAVDSVPAILAITTDPFLVLTSNGFAILGLRSLYFVLAGMLDRFVYLKLGLGAILVFAGAKMLLSDMIHLPTFVSLGVIGAILGVSLVTSLIATRRVADAGGKPVAPRG
ncbi:MAG TPA: TerC family protein [Candidatus Caenarcaniphilales bacterium]|nr:TerC family protein [Candidatus Caenarcaniphilales bacterium]